MSCVTPYRCVTEGGATSRISIVSYSHCRMVTMATIVSLLTLSLISFVSCVMCHGSPCRMVSKGHNGLITNIESEILCVMCQVSCVTVVLVEWLQIVTMDS